MSRYEDLEEIDWWHCPELAFNASIPEQFRAIAIGWIEDDEYGRGEVAAGDLELLRRLCENCTIDQGFLGYHTCALCGAFDDRGEVLLTSGERRYVMPHMILHYVTAHGYLPPPVFLEDLRKYFRA